MAFNGYLLRLLSTNGVYTEIPLGLLRYSTYKVTPDQRLDLDTGLRDLTGVMHRVVVNHTATKIEVNTISLNDSQANQLITLLMSHVRNYLERDVYLQYWDTESQSYKTGHFYIPDIQWQIRNVDTVRNKINYNETRIAFIEY